MSSGPPPDHWMAHIYMDSTPTKNALPKQLRVRSLGTKITETEYAQCEKSATRRGQTLSEWCRRVLLEAVSGTAQTPEAEAILAELLALRKIMINLLYSQAAKQPLNERHMRELIDAADSDKLAKAVERLQAVRTVRAEVMPYGECSKSVHDSSGNGAPPGRMAE